MRSRSLLWLWNLVWAGSLIVWLAIIALYLWLPADGATGDLESFGPEGFRVQWLLERRVSEGGLQPGDVIASAGGHTVDEWLNGAERGPEWSTGGIVRYEIVRDRQPMTLEIQLSPVPLQAILARWAPQLLVALMVFAIGTYVFRRRPQELAARLLMLFCVAMALQYWGDAYNFQYATLPWRWPFWFHLTYEHLMYSLSIATICYFALIFPTAHPLSQRFPHLVPLVLYLSFPVVIAGAMALSPGWTAALRNGNHASWVVALIQIGVAIAAGIRSVRTARDPVTRAQIRWIVWCGGLGVAVLVPGYVLPLMLNGRPLLPHPVTMLVIALVPFTVAVAVLRYRLFDIEFIINRTLVYGTLTTLLAGLYLILVRLLTLVVEGVWQGQNNSLAIFLATLTIALAFDPLRRRVQDLIDRTFYRTKLDYQRLLPEMSERLATSIILDRLNALLTQELPQRLQIAWAELVVLEPEGERFVLADSRHACCILLTSHPVVQTLGDLGRPLVRQQLPSGLPVETQVFLEQNAVELSIPLLVGTELVGLYNLGPKLSGGAYSRDEVHLLRLLGQQAAVAVENSRLYERAQQEIAERRRAEGQLKTSLAEKEMLLKEIHHRVKNNLQVISSLLYLQSRQIEDKEALKMFEESQHRVRSMALVHERLYQTRDLASVDLTDYLQRLASYLLRSYRGTSPSIRLNVNAEPIALGIDLAVPCGLIVNELVSNSLKHAFSDGQEGEITIDLGIDPEGRYRLVVGDNGLGLPDDLDFRNTESLGLRLVSTLVDQLEGTIELDRSNGTRFTFSFREAEHESRDPAKRDGDGNGTNLDR
ncbi:MAG: histidine kinase dimerization/phosphoacceptor domain -containing protein [Anaerolineae bacterium]